MNIVVVTYARFPEGDAESVRLHSFGKILRELGHSVLYVGMGFSDFRKKNFFDQFPYISLRKKSSNKMCKFVNFLNHKNYLKSVLEDLQKENTIDCIIYADLPLLSIFYLKRFCFNNNIQLVVDSVEWYSPQQFKLNILSPTFLAKEIENRFLINKKIKVIAISEYLTNYFVKKGCICYNIPVIMDINAIDNIKKENDKLYLLYAGSPGKKDYVVNMLKGILLLTNDERKKVVFNLAGVSKNDIKKQFSKTDIEILNSCVNFLGRIPRQSVFELLKVTDFTVLLRSSKQRYAKAGFPTKFVESLASGTPIILNLTSNLANYVSNLNEILEVRDCSEESFSKILSLAIELDEETKNDMKILSRKCAEEKFNYRSYLGMFEKILNERIIHE